jgi:hypothetical protein
LGCGPTLGSVRTLGILAGETRPSNKPSEVPISNEVRVPASLVEMYIELNITFCGHKRDNIHGDTTNVNYGVQDVLNISKWA